MLCSVGIPEAFHRNEPTVRDHSAPDGLDVRQQSRVPSALLNAVFEQLLTHNGLDAVASDQEVTGRGGPVCELQEYLWFAPVRDRGVRVRSQAFAKVGCACWETVDEDVEEVCPVEADAAICRKLKRPG